MVKAYQVTDEFEGGSVIRFAEHSVTARREGANELNTDFEGVTCRRLPSADAFADNPSGIKKHLIEECGWWWDCMQCDTRVDADCEGRVYDTVGRPYCSQSCHDALNTCKAAIEQQEKK